MFEPNDGQTMAVPLFSLFRFESELVMRTVNNEPKSRVDDMQLLWKRKAWEKLDQRKSMVSLQKSRKTKSISESYQKSISIDLYTSYLYFNISVLQI